MADFGIRFFLCNIFICIIIGFLIIVKRAFKNYLTSRMQFNLWFLLLGILAVPFVPFRPASFTQIFTLFGIWKHAPISTNEITEKLTQTTKWSPKTIQTLIKRLVTKGALSYEKQSRVFVYTPLIEEKEYIGQESHSFLERYYDGDITAMLSAYIEDDKLSESEIDTLRSLLAKGSKNRGN